VLPECNKVVYS